MLSTTMPNAFINNKLHLTVQHSIKQMLGDDNVFLEYSVKGHRADVYWQTKNVVFEVQCSPISLEVAKRRTEDFEKLGIQIVWILHQKTYDKKKLSRAEEYLLKNKQVYYSNISQHGEGIIFTREEAIFDWTRVAKSEPVKIDLRKPRYMRFSRKVVFEGDLGTTSFRKRMILYKDIWKIKARLTIKHLKRSSRYYYHLLVWKIQF